MQKKIKVPIIFVLQILIILSVTCNANAKLNDCVSIFEEMLKTSDFLPEVTSRKNLLIDLYDISVNDDSIFFKVYDSDTEKNKNRGVLAVLGWVKYNYKRKSMENITYDELNPVKVIYNKELEIKFNQCLDFHKINIKDLATSE
ncbi:hypothetical protein A9G34_07495 [Gilliamella sp. Choc4-2]|jgi:hypothetical protein|uniref:hypothetical protein n=1 Tax=unclassified Gilliamella TaxID=2685620 RepID=UPI00080E30CB|nr:hypothetical protein [Gilliamella apicola]OCG32515.1 hypothetical protein A9G33_03530 [Gilliamella apicola]OCG44004.1 hypothetical protein A9G34_07495 [Gilliamella apicola]OCG56627.1 hypothetical protein A9G36_02815 [Gilliamella apicola]OCG65578.1 hypothetical protein A9G48_10645 [Gilliamella apicola]